MCGRNVNGWETFGVATFTAAGRTFAPSREFKRLYLHKQVGAAGAPPGFEGGRPAGRRFNSAGVLAECRQSRGQFVGSVAHSYIG